MTNKAYRAIRAAILDGELASGTMISIYSLADTLGISRTPVREALVRLAEADMVRFERNRGVRILETSTKDLADIWSLRLALELPAVKIATSRIDEEGREELARIVRDMEQASRDQDPERLSELDIDFHRAILRAAGNDRLVRIVDNLRDLIHTRGVTTANQSRSLDAIAAEHERVHSAIAAGDIDAAVESMRSHLVNTSALMLDQRGAVDLHEEVCRWIPEA